MSKFKKQWAKNVFKSHNKKVVKSVIPEVVKPAVKSVVKPAVSAFMEACHIGPVEIIPNLFIGSYKESYDMILKGVEVLFPLHAAFGDIWSKGFKGQIIYYPIEDFNVLPTDIAERLVGEILHCLAAGHKVGLYCLGGHGRTGYIASIVIGRLKLAEDPIAFIRKNYCNLAVESTAQVKHIAEMTNQPELTERYATVDDFDYSHYFKGYQSYKKYF